MDSLLAGALVLITGYYAIQTHKMVKEMRTARMQPVTPHIIVNIVWSEWPLATVAIQNVGTGVAQDLDIELSYVGAKTGDTATIAWRPRAMSPGERHRFQPPQPESKDAPKTIRLDAFCEFYREIRLRGTCNDQVGRKHEVNDSIVDLPKQYQMARDANLRIGIGDTDLGEIALQLRQLREDLAHRAAFRPN